MSTWGSALDVPPLPRLDADTRADVCVVGGGVAGLSVAYALVQEGMDVVLLEAGALGGGETARTTAHLVNALDHGYREIVSVHGEEAAALAADSHARAIDRIAETCARERIECDFERVAGYLCAAPDGDRETLAGELQAARLARVAGVEMLDAVPGWWRDAGPCVHFPRQAQMHPLRYLSGVAAATLRRGARIHTDSAVREIRGSGLVRVATKHGPAVTATAVVVATNTPINYAVTLHTKQAAYRTYVVALDIPKLESPAALYWDTLDPFHYVRVQRLRSDHDLLLVGGEDHKTGQDDVGPAARFTRLEQWARPRCPQAGAVVARWSGQIMESMDGLGFIGAPDDDRRVFVVSGDSGNGLTHGTIAGMLLTDLIRGRHNPWAPIYDPARLRWHALVTFALENLNVASQYVAWLEPGSRNAEAIPRDCGAVVRRGLARVAVYRDAGGRLHERSAVCPHLGCIVAWNRAEGSWDCPCHGSRFDPYGEVLHGPANRGLAVLADEDRSAAAPHA